MLLIHAMSPHKGCGCWCLLALVGYFVTQSNTTPTGDGVSWLGRLDRRLTNSHWTGHPFRGTCAVPVIVEVHMLSAPVAVTPAAMPPVTENVPITMEESVGPH